MDRNEILSEIRRVAAELGTTSLGRERFESLTGIAEGSWLGKHWLNWTEAVTEAGLKPNRLNEAHDADFVFASLATLTKKLGRYPTIAAIKMERASSKDFPAHGVFQRFGNRSMQIALLRQFASRQGDLALIELLAREGTAEAAVPRDECLVGSDGHVYMMRLGKHFKIGKTFSVPRRHREIALELPQRPDVVHSIRTDDPDGIEAYWHRRFEAKRTNGEWFALSGEDVRSFKRRKFM